MADLKASAVLNYGDGVFDRIIMNKKTAGDDLQVGDFLKQDDSGGVEKMAAAADDSLFIGVCGTLSKDADGPTEIIVYTKCVVEVPAESAQYYMGAGLKFNTSGTVEADGNANTICWVYEKDTGASATSLKAVVDVLKLGKGETFPVSA